MTANDWILPWFMLVRIMYIMLNMVGLFLSSWFVLKFMCSALSVA